MGHIVDYAPFVSFGWADQPFEYQPLDAWYDEGAARYMAHARRQLADGQCGHAGCSLRKAAHKARQAKSLRKLLRGDHDRP